MPGRSSDRLGDSGMDNVMIKACRPATPLTRQVPRVRHVSRKRVRLSVRVIHHDTEVLDQRAPHAT